MCYVTVTELKNNLSYYLEKSMTEDVYITKNNKVISVLVSPVIKALQEVNELHEKYNISGYEDITYEDIIAEEIEKR